MPIRPELRKFYGREWQTVTRPRILDRAGHCCESCGKPNRVNVQTVSGVEILAGTRSYFMWWSQPGHEPGSAWINRFGVPLTGLVMTHGARWLHVVLTVAHLNHKPGDDRDENLAALCQWCHLTYDLIHHKHSREARKDGERPLFVQLREIDQADDLQAR